MGKNKDYKAFIGVKMTTDNKNSDIVMEGAYKDLVVLTISLLYRLIHSGPADFTLDEFIKIYRRNEEKIKDVYVERTDYDDNLD